MASIRALHMARSLEDLNKKIPSNKLKQASPKVLCKMAEKIFLKARDARLQDGDEEEAYVLFMRFLDAISHIRQSREYKSNKKEFDKLLPSSRATQALEEAEKLSKHLQERYAELSEPADKKARYEDEHTQNLDSNHVVPSSPGKVLSAEQLYKQSKPLLPQQSSTPGGLDVGWFGNQSSTSLLDTLPHSTPSVPTVSPKQLYDYLQNSPDEVLVLDCRPRGEYLTSHVDAKRFQQWLCVPEETVKRGISDSSVVSFLPPAGKKHWTERRKKRWIVLVDDASTAEMLSGSNNVPILILKDAIHKWDNTVQNEPFILDGGYAKWYLTYAPLCVGSYRRKEGSIVEEDSSTKKQQQVSLDYPSFPTMIEPVTQEEPASKEEEKVAVNGMPPEPAAMSRHDSGLEDDPAGHTDQIDGHDGQESSTQSPQPAPIVHPVPLLPVITPTPQILPSYAPPPPSAIPVALTLEGESALLTPTLSRDNDILADVPELDPSMPNGSLPDMQYVQVPHAADTGIPLPSQQNNFQTVTHHLPPEGVQPHPLPPESVQQSTQYPGDPRVPQSYSHNGAPQEQGYLPQAMDIHPSSHTVDHHRPMPGQQVQEPGYLPHAVGVHPSSHMVAHHPPMSGQQIQEPGYLPQAMGVHPSSHVVAHYQPMPGQQTPKVYSAQVGHSQDMPHGTQHHAGYYVHPSNPVGERVFQFQGQSPQCSTTPYSHGEGVAPPPQMVQPHPLHPPQQPHPPHPAQQSYPPDLPLQPHPPQPQIQSYPSDPSQQPHPPDPAMQPHPPQVLQQAVSAPTTSSVQSYGPPPATQQVTPGQRDFEPPQMAPQMPEQPPNQRVVNGPIPNPPGYAESHRLPSCPPVQPPIPPPVSLTQPNQFTQSTQFARSDASSQPQRDALTTDVPTQQQAEKSKELLEKEARIQELERRLADKEKEAQLERETEKAMEDMKAQQEKEKRDLLVNELKQQLESERTKLMDQVEQEKEAARSQLQQEKAQQAQELEQQRQALALEREQHERRVVEEQLRLQQMKEQFEREKVMVEQQQKEILQHLQLRKQKENERMFSVSQGMPPGWEKRLDPGTGRFYYVDHSTKTTHWSPPSNWLAYQAELQRQRELQEQQQQPMQQVPQGKTYAQPQVQGPGMPQVQGPGMPQVGPGQVQPGRSPVVQTPHPQPPASVTRATPQSQLVVPPASATRPAPQSQQVVPPSGQQTVPAQVQPGRVSAARQPAPTPTPSPSAPPQPTIPQPQKTDAKAAIPVVDRSTKPVGVPAQRPASVPVVDRSKKPVMTPSMHRRKLESLQPVFGSQGYVLTGLRNLGNTCFMNSMLQCLCSTTPFMEHFVSGNFWNDINRTNPLGRGGKVAEEFGFLMKVMWSGQYRSVSPRDFKHTICKFAPQFAGNAQQDSQELLAFLMDGLHEDLNRIKLREVSEPRDFSGMADTQIAKLSWEDHKKRNDSLVVDWFQGQFRSTVVCLRCKYRSVTFEAFMYLSLPIPPGSRPYTLKECIQLFTKEERVTGTDRWYCSKCKGHQDAIKKIEIWKLPRILIVCLKRFLFEGVWREKRQNDVDFPLSSLDMTPHVVGVRPPGLYKLYAVSNHYGTMTGGHYTAFCMNPYKRRFYCFDDHEVKDVKNVRSNAAYVLFYTATDFSTPRML